MTALTKCAFCKSVLAPWEVHRGGCACRERQSSMNADTLYAVACNSDGPLPIHDLIRIAERDFGAAVSKSTALASVGPDPRFCWSGSGTYGLYRHGVLPGPRNLEESARLVLLSAGRLHIDVVDFVLKQLGYRFAIGSLRNAVSWSHHITWSRYGWSHPVGEDARLQLRRDIPVVPDRQKAEFDEIIDRLQRRIQRALETREERVASSPSTLSDVLGVDWGDG